MYNGKDWHDEVKVSPLIKAEIIDKPSIEKKIEDTNKQYYTWKEDNVNASVI